MPSWPLTVREIAELVGGTVSGDGSLRIAGVASVESAGAEHVTFAADARRVRELERSEAGAAIVATSPS